VDVLFLLIPLSVVLILAIGVVFWWSVASGQYEDLEGPAHRILLDDEELETAGTAAAKDDLTLVKSDPGARP
jgi:cbb3-type cytochrome oxidase maturation protein